MGGCRSRTRAAGSYESCSVYKAEKTLGFHRHTPDAIDYAFRKVLNGPNISETAWKWMINTCGVAPHDLFEQFQGPEGYKASKLFVFAILQSNGDKDTKLELIYDFWDKERVNKLDKAAVTDITKIMAEVSSKYVSQVIPDSKLSSDRKMTYQNDLNKRRDQWVDEKLAGVKDENSRDDFLKHFEFIGSTKDVRTEIEMVKLKPTKFVAAFDAFAKSIL